MTDNNKWMDPEFIAAGDKIGNTGQATAKKKELELITLDHWRVKEWAHNIITAGRNRENECIIVNDMTEVGDESPRYQCVRFFYVGGEVEASAEIQRGPAWEVFDYLMKNGGYTPVKFGKPS